MERQRGPSSRRSASILPLQSVGLQEWLTALGTASATQAGAFSGKYDLKRTAIALRAASLWATQAASQRGYSEIRQGSDRAQNFPLHPQGKSARPFPAHHRGRRRTPRHDHRARHRPGGFQKAPRRHGQSVGRVAAEGAVKRESRLIPFASQRGLFYPSDMPSFDIVSQVNSMEIENAVNQAKKELANRFDFKGSKAEIVLEKNEIKLSAEDDFKVRTLNEMVIGKLAKRGISLKSVEQCEPDISPLGHARQVIKIK